ncbi:MAG TPA: GGDEF domain-containing protein, partial [Acidimicrobiales bacterium]|nr:GGDEF domain-containing protein [Acidimicrobiales bacterium]
AARLGGDEFVVVVDPMPSSPSGLEHLVGRLQASLSAPYMILGHEVSISASIGIVTSPMGYSRAEDILRDADMAMYSAKKAERGSHALFRPELHDAAQSGCWPKPVPS